MTSSILGPNGLPFADLSGERSYKTFTKGDVVASLQWIDLQRHNPDYPEDGPVPCMVLHHAHRRIEIGCYVIPQALAFNYIGRDGLPTIKFVDARAKALIELGFEPNDKSAVTRIYDLLYEALPDLFKMPGTQPADLEIKRQTYGIEATMRINGRAVHQEVL